MAKKPTKAAAIVAPQIRARLQAIADKPIHLLPNPDHGNKAVAAIAALDRGEVDEAMNLVWILGNEAGTVLLFEAFERQFRIGIKTCAGVDNSSSKRKQKIESRLQDAFEEYARLRNDREGRKPTDAALLKMAAAKFGLHERTLRNHLPAYLK
jgi:hypothetical protein